ncbi:exodeoxyribonuclease VII large subunit [Clostridium sp. 'White wine YQ']|uniref:exodeoxyribonuclease VII large subunit n=1 Tax=Clostridium sp. 'White wine YQ' TaxID=3027474 RepID=UPI002366C55B|nr:exodeoxyribonuclease VII large subunit [Clostridium sp. 'White wine YQ']MDD7793935.1 exodeoxyribonuclease VII large subunit [Clostridium sp. 'White wine YQ']
MNIKTLSVTDVNNYIKRIFDNDFILNNLSVKGEISNLKYHSSGHIYFSLKDEFSKVNCVMFKSDASKNEFRMKEGQNIIVKARLSSYVKEGNYQLYVREAQDAGIGDLYSQFENLKNKLKDEGLFDEKHKKNLPSYVKNLGVITSETGAAIKDIINVVHRRNNSIDIFLYPSLVQGESAPESLIKGLKYFNERAKEKVDVIIIGRGGGSIEELWAFNNEELAKEIFKSKIPVVSAVGHEVDFTICDFVSDVRAATPSAAAEIISTDKEELLGEIAYIENKLNSAIENKIYNSRIRIEHLEKVLKLNSPKNYLINKYKEVETLKGLLDRGISLKINSEKQNLIKLKNVLEAKSPINVLNRGYVILESDKGKLIKSKEEFTSGEYKINFKDGYKRAEINIIKE